MENITYEQAKEAKEAKDILIKYLRDLEARPSPMEVIALLVLEEIL